MNIYFFSLDLMTKINRCFSFYVSAYNHHKIVQKEREIEIGRLNDNI